jgi:hypothetical protein
VREAEILDEIDSLVPESKEALKLQSAQAPIKNNKKGSKLAKQVVYYLQLMPVAYGGILKYEGFDGQAISAAGLEKIINRK